MQSTQFLSTKEEPKTDTARPSRLLSMPKVIAGALGAATAAIVGSQLGVTGTVLGAAVGSIATTVAGTAYQASIEKTHHRLRGWWRHNGPAEEPASPEATGSDGGSPDETAVYTEQDTQILDTSPDHEMATSPGSEQASAPSVRPRRRWIVIVGASVASAVVAFGLAIAVITGFEAVTGSNLSGGEGTSIGQAVRNSGREAEAAPVNDSPGQSSEQQGSDNQAPVQQDATVEPTSTTSGTTQPTATSTATTEPSVTPTSAATQVPTGSSQTTGTTQTTQPHEGTATTAPQSTTTPVQ